jgi:hypothetical protein
MDVMEKFINFQLQKRKVLPGRDSVAVCEAQAVGQLRICWIATADAAADAAARHCPFEALAVLLETPGAATFAAHLMSCHRSKSRGIWSRWFIFRVKSSGISLQHALHGGLAYTRGLRYILT